MLTESILLIAVRRTWLSESFLARSRRIFLSSSVDGLSADIYSFRVIAFELFHLGLNSFLRNADISMFSPLLLRFCLSVETGARIREPIS